MAYQIPVALSPIQPSRIPLALPVPPSKPFVVLKELGEGAFGKVLKIQRHSDKKVSQVVCRSATPLILYPDPRVEEGQGQQIGQTQCSPRG